MRRAASGKPIERVLSFGGICGLIGVVSDLLSPVGNYTLGALVFGGSVLFIGLALVPFLTLRSAITQTSLAFGTLLIAISSFFLFVAPYDGRGFVAGEIAWAAKAQKELFGLSESVAQISQDTSAIADSTSRIAENSDIVASLSFSREGFLYALDAQDTENIRLYCGRGYRVDTVAHLLQSAKETAFASERNFSLLSSLDCFDTLKLCDPKNWVHEWRPLAHRLAEDRIGVLCGQIGLDQLIVERARLDR